MEDNAKPTPKKCEINIECNEIDKSSPGMKCKITLTGECENLKLKE